MVVTDLPSGEYATNLAWRVLGLLSQPIEINGQMVHTSSSIGIALSDAHTTNADSFLKNADLALYRAKSDGRGTFRFFETAMDAAAQERRALEVDLRKAIAFGQLELHYQPLVDIETNAIIAMEALVRWRHPERGLIPPSDFIGIAEETGVIMQLGDWVLARACKDAINWPSRIRVAVNLSPAQFKSRDVAEKIIRIVTQSTLMPERLELEVTESLLFRNTEANLTALHKLKEFGIQIAMDDFGTGYSSLGNLRSFPFDKIKIDRSFVAEMARNPDSQAIIQAVLNLGRSLGMKTTAEGVESVDQVAYLRAQGCTEVQGYYYSAPVPGHAVDELLRHEGSLADYRRTA
jgi:predicted signal transduction protein with EAL and GGDEF domain